MTDTLIAGVELGQAPHRYTVEKHRRHAARYRYAREGDATETWFEHLIDLMPHLFLWYGLLDPQEYEHLHALEAAE